VWQQYGLVKLLDWEVGGCHDSLFGALAAEARGFGSNSRAFFLPFSLFC